jgi:hypothetical protein
MTKEEEDQLLKDPIIILGAPRSGTTILSQILGQHPDVALLIEPRFTWRYGNDRKSDMLQPDDARPEVIRHIRRRFAKFVKDQGKTRLVEKTPSNSLRPEFVNRVFPDAKFIHIIRNGYDACLAGEDFWDKHSTGLTKIAEGRLLQRLNELNVKRLQYYFPEFLRRALPKPLGRFLGPNPWGPRLPGHRQMLSELGATFVACQ